MAKKYYPVRCLQILPIGYQFNDSTEPAVLAELDIVMIPGEEQNYKITRKADLQRFEQDLRER